MREDIEEYAKDKAYGKEADEAPRMNLHDGQPFVEYFDEWNYHTQ